MESFHYLKQINPNLKIRYEEVEKMLMYGSRSFLDALGNLLEVYTQFYALKFRVDFEIGASHGKIMNALKSFLIEMISMDETTFYKVKKISTEVNLHKHKRMGFVDANSCLNNLKSFFDFYAKISEYSSGEFDEVFDWKYFKSIYGFFSPEKVIMMFRSNQTATTKSKNDIQDMERKIHNYEGIVDIFSKVKFG